MKKKSAFTLIELLVVVSIIAILMALLFPVISSYMERGRSMTCLNNLRSLGTGIIQYMSDSKGSFFPRQAPTEDMWANALRSNYVKDWRSFRSPFDKVSLARPNADSVPVPGAGLAVVPISYGLNDNLFDTFEGKWKAPTSTLILGAAAVDTSVQSKLPVFRPDAISSANVSIKPTGLAGSYTKYGTHQLRTKLIVLYADNHVSDTEWDKFCEADSNKGKRQWDPFYEE